MPQYNNKILTLTNRFIKQAHINGFLDEIILFTIINCKCVNNSTLFMFFSYIYNLIVLWSSELIVQILVMLIRRNIVDLYFVDPDNIEF